MKSRFLDSMGEALSLVRKSNLSEATALLRKALSGADAASAANEPARRRPVLVGLESAPRAPLGDVLEALRVGRANRPKTRHARFEAPRHPDDERFTSRTYHGPAGSLDYRLYVPADHAERKLALLLMLHGCTQNPDDFATGTQMNRLADEFGLIVAYPHQPQSANASGCWNWFDKRHQHRGSGEPARLAGLARSLGQEFGVDRERTFAAGLSAGGAMAEILATTYPDVFEAVGIHSGLPYKAAKDLPSAFAAMKGAGAAPPPRAVGEAQCRKIVFHGGADATVNPVNAERILEQARGGGAFREIETDQTLGSRRVKRAVLEDANGEPVVELWSVEGGGHAWFGGDNRGTYTESVGPDASRLMARFFLKQ